MERISGEGKRKEEVAPWYMLLYWLVKIRIQKACEFGLF